MGQVVYLGLCLLGCLILGSSSIPVEAANSTQVAPRSPCPPGALSFRHFCYFYVDNAVAWYTAEVECQKLRPGSHLVSFSSSKEEKLVSTYIRSRNSQTNCIWTGLTAEPDTYSVRLDWQWSDGSPYNSRSPLWGGQSPSTDISSPECLFLTNIQNPSYPSRWLPENCDSTWPYVCKYKVGN